MTLFSGGRTFGVKYSPVYKLVDVAISTLKTFGVDNLLADLVQSPGGQLWYKVILCYTIQMN